VKTRAGFVSNSSSSCFILDLRENTIQVQDLIDGFSLAGIDRPRFADRRSAIAVGEDVSKYLIEHRLYLGDEWIGLGIAGWLESWIKKLGEENIVFIRISDEGMGGYYPAGNVRAIAVDEIEYH